MTFINLTDEDLIANRQMVLSDKQRNMIASQRLVWIAGTSGLIGVVLSLIAILFLKLNIPAFANHGELFFIVAVLLFWLWLLRHMPRHWKQTNLDLKTGLIKITEGQVQTNIAFGIGLIRSVYYYIYINGCSFQISKSLYPLFNVGHIYRVYHTDHSRQFLGAYVIDETFKKSEAPSIETELLTLRELEILHLIANGLTNRQIANQLSLSVNTIKMYTSQLYQKLGVNRRTAAVALARKLNML